MQQNLMQKIGDIETPIRDLETAVKALSHLAASDDEEIEVVVSFIATSLDGIAVELRSAFEKGVELDRLELGPKVVEG